MLAQTLALHSVKCPLLCKSLTRLACVDKLYVVNHDIYDSVTVELRHAYRWAEEMIAKSILQVCEHASNS